MRKRRIWGLQRARRGKIWAEGDKKILSALLELRKMRDEGKIKYLGLLGMLLTHKPFSLTFAPLRVSYCHPNLQNSL
jgi:hypothetical protein